MPEVWAELRAKLPSDVRGRVEEAVDAQYCRVRVVREGGPEGRQFASAPSKPLRLRVPQPPAPSAHLWCVQELPSVVLLWGLAGGLLLEPGDCAISPAMQYQVWNFRCENASPEPENH